MGTIYIHINIHLENNIYVERDMWDVWVHHIFYIMFKCVIVGDGQGRVGMQSVGEHDLLNLFVSYSVFE